MSLRILVRDGPERALALTSQDYALIFRLAPTPRARPAGPPRTPQCMLDFQPLAGADLDGFAPMRTPAAHGTLGLFAVQGDVFLCVITGASPAAMVRPGENVQRIRAVEFICLNRAEFDGLIGTMLGSNYDPAAADAADDRHALGYSDETPVHPCQALQQLLSAGTFYYSVDFDLTTRLQARVHEPSALDPEALDRRFLWNAYLLEPLLQFRGHLSSTERQALDDAHILTLAIRGYVGAVTIPSAACPLEADPRHPSSLTLISRLSCRRAGTRFNARGIDDEGHVANFVESESIYYAPDGRCFSFTQIRGSVPVFWEQTGGLLPQQQKIQLTRSREATQPAFDRHFEGLELKYGAVQILNLLSASKTGEAELTNRYNQHIRACSINARSSLPRGESESRSAEHAMLRGIHFDFNAEARSGQSYDVDRVVRQLVQGPLDGFAYFMAVGPGQETAVLLQQEGVFRTNCLDCLDRTNLVQTMLSRAVLEMFFAQQQYQQRQLGSQKHPSLPQFAAPPGAAPGTVSAGVWARHSTLWADNGDALSRIYAGTGALKSSFTRHGKMSLAGALADARKGATRLYMQAFVDTQRQAVVDALLGRTLLGAGGESAPTTESSDGSVQLYDPVHAAVNAALLARRDAYTTEKEITVWAGTFNLNGRRAGLKADLGSWLQPRLKLANGDITGDPNEAEHAQGWTMSEWADPERRPDIMVVGFQELVELTANNIMATEPTRRQEWEEAVSTALNGSDGRSGDYVLLRSGQLVGAALMVFVRSSALPLIRNAEGAIKKTGMSGMAGNKGAVAIRLDYAQTRLCFVTAHLAAGFANYEERNHDYATIAYGLRFPRGRGLADHDAVWWLGDFNYRIGLANERVRPAATDPAQWASLFRHDQLNLQMVAGRAFSYCHEAPLRFAPTYRYDVGADAYDSSEKQRIPAWTDRVLWRSDDAGVRALAYGAAPVRCSDHRPVFALFRVAVRVEDERRKAALRRELDAARRAQVGGVAATAAGQPSSSSSDNDDDRRGDAEPGVQAASSDHNRWWLGHGLPARSTVADAHPGAAPNPRRPANPFTPSAEPDWVLVPRPTDGANDSPSSKGPAPEPPPPRRSKAATSSTASSDARSEPAAAAARNSSARPASAASAASGGTGAPPVPRKPVGLSRAVTAAAASGGTSRPSPLPPPVQTAPTAAASASPTRATASPTYTPSAGTRDAAPQHVIDTGFPPPPRRRTGPSGAIAAPRTTSGYGSSSGGGGGAPLSRRPTDPPAATMAPAPAARRPPGSTAGSGGPTSSPTAGPRGGVPPANVMDAEGDTLDGFVALRPTRPGG